MAYKRKNSPYWWVSLTDTGGKRVKRSTGATDRKEAEALEAKWKSELYRKEVWEETPEVSFEEVILYWLNAKDRHENEILRAGTLRKSFSGRVMNRLSRRDVVVHRNKRLTEGMKPSTINRDLALLSSSINLYNEEMEYDLPNPVKGRKLKEPEGRLRWITRAESVALIEASRKNHLAPHLPDFITLALNTGMRKQEMLGLEWRRVDLQTGLIYLEGQHTKTSRRRSIPINKNAKSALMGRLRYRSETCPASPWVFAHPDGERIQNIRRSWETACRHAKIKDFRIHDMRHTCAAWLVTAGVALPEVRDLLGHSSVKMTERYAHLAPENVRAAVAVLDGQKPVSKPASESHFSPIGNQG